MLLIPTKLQDLLNLPNILNLLLFLLLVFLGVTARVIIDLEILNKSKQEIKFFHRYILAAILSYVIEFYIAEKEYLRKYYSEIIILFCIFVNDIVIFIFSNRIKIFAYLFKAITKGMIDLTNSNKNKDNDQVSSN